MGATYSNEAADYEFNNTPFAHGTFRACFSCKHKRTGKKYVVKAFKRSSPKSVEAWRPDVSVYKKAQIMADKFNTCMLAISPRTKPKQINFVEPLTGTVTQEGGFYLLGVWNLSQTEVYLNESVLIEPFLEGDYIKFNSNGGYEDRGYQELTALTHWTWEKTGHRYMLCDLQGVAVNGGYLLTDPIVHSYDKVFENTGGDLGAYGMALVMCNHTCNNICRLLGLQDAAVIKEQICRKTNIDISTLMHARTSYLFDVSYEDEQRAKQLYTLVAPLGINTLF